ncbi:MAG: CHAT domain-containing protein [Bacteroidia bacterium]|nr:CHAT domain-containing protein [Bacteroidia bacterium]
MRNQISQMQGAEIEDREQKITELEKQTNEQERKLVRLSSEFVDIRNLFDYKWEDVQKALKPGEAAIEFIYFKSESSKAAVGSRQQQSDTTNVITREERPKQSAGNNEIALASPRNDEGKPPRNDVITYCALLITHGSKKPQTIRLFEENELQAIIGKTSETGYRFINSLYGLNSHALEQLIWQPLESALAGINTVYFAPVGVLNKISFAALSKESGKLLCDEYNLHQVSTTGKLINQEAKTETKLTATVFGGIDYNPDTVKHDPDGEQGWQYLSGTLNEKERIEKQFKTNKIACKSYSGKEAKEERFKELFAENGSHPGILHVSTHGFFYPDPEKLRKQNKDEVGSGDIKFRGSIGFGYWMFVQNKNPMMRSGLVFAGANKVWYEDWGRTNDEGVLTAYEVSNLNMKNTQLVVLSACETGLGDIKGSEGVYGLQRAFKMAGVKYIIMSLWQVADKETEEFMTTFYTKLLKQKDIRKAFNETQAEMRDKYDPYYWSAFVLIE